EGDNWNNNSGWKDGTLEADGFGPIGSEGDWYGIEVSDDHTAEINLRYSNLTGSIPSELGDLSHLRVLKLNENRLSGSIPPELGNLSNLEDLSLWDNRLSGSIPLELSNLGNLKFLLLADNQLSGSIPSELGDLSNLENIYLGQNQLSGGIPSELGKLSNLEWLTLYDNRLSGSIPPELGNLGNLQFLYLRGNHLSGSIPPELGALSNLRALFLESNQLSGSIPLSLTNLIECRTLVIYYNALYTSNDELRIFLESRGSHWEVRQTIAATNITVTGTSRTSISVSWTPIHYSSPGSYRVYYSTTSGPPWIYSGKTAGKDTSFYEVTGLNSGTRYYFKIQTQTDPYIGNKNTVVSEPSQVVSAVTGSSMEEKAPPFGSFDTPVDGLTARGSIPVTGWALDDSGIDTIKIYREIGSRLVYIGDGVFIEGARPDVAAAYPAYPVNTEAGWGYMLLTNFLPNNGNGTFVLHAIATDLAGKTTTLGTKTIECDNANTVKPFGAIDTPTQGGSASGTGFVNFGWALTPQPNIIPVDGSTITVWVDGVPLGNPVYNQYRSDIATLFPGYNNSNGAIGSYYLDTTGYDNGVHTIQWTVKDDAGNFDGIGSRYFIIINSQDRTQSQTHAIRHPDIQIHDIPPDTMTSLKIKTGYNREYPNEEKQYSDNEPAHIEIPELGRIELNMTDETGERENNSFTSFVGYQLVGNGLRPLPAGSYLDKRRGLFYWQAGLGFLGNYHLVFIKTSGLGNQTRKEVLVTIKPKQ
ncbi:MAG: hypothetical protein GY940_17130, partial [bacterium]|nr:hypothetical protein [bacterium]